MIEELTRGFYCYYNGGMRVDIFVYSNDPLKWIHVNQSNPKQTRCFYCVKEPWLQQTFSRFKTHHVKEKGLYSDLNRAERYERIRRKRKALRTIKKIL